MTRPHSGLPEGRAALGAMRVLGPRARTSCLRQALQGATSERAQNWRPWQTGLSWSGRVEGGVSGGEGMASQHGA